MQNLRNLGKIFGPVGLGLAVTGLLAVRAEAGGHGRYVAVQTVAAAPVAAAPVAYAPVAYAPAKLGHHQKYAYMALSPVQTVAAAPVQYVQAAPVQTVAAAPVQYAQVQAAPVQTVAAAPVQYVQVQAAPAQAAAAAPTQAAAAAPTVYVYTYGQAAAAPRAAAAPTGARLSSDADRNNIVQQLKDYAAVLRENGESADSIRSKLLTRSRALYAEFAGIDAADLNSNDNQDAQSLVDQAVGGAAAAGSTSSSSSNGTQSQQVQVMQVQSTAAAAPVQLFLPVHRHPFHPNRYSY